MRTALLLPLALASLVNAHGNHGQKPIVAEDASWMEKHMAGTSVAPWPVF
jgi:hypothetical protein